MRLRARSRPKDFERAQLYDQVIADCLAEARERISEYKEACDAIEACQEAVTEAERSVSELEWNRIMEQSRAEQFEGEMEAQRRRTAHREELQAIDAEDAAERQQRLADVQENAAAWQVEAERVERALTRRKLHEGANREWGASYQIEPIWPYL